MQNAQPSGFNLSFFDMKKAKRNFTTDRRYVVGYARLSFDEDGDNFVSIENQMSILEDFYHQQYENATSEYLFIADDNVSGYKFEREGLYRLTALIEEGKCNIILAKDLSRIGRHGALTQLFIEQCERVGVRIHAMSDYDSEKESDDLILGIRAWSNERVVKDTSAKIKKIVQHKQSNGTWFCAAPFGYYVIDYQKGKVGIVEEAANIVRRIFDMYLHGSGLTAIARALTNDHTPTPNMFLREMALANGDEFKKRVSANWQPSFISTILSNEFYVGTLVTGRYQRDGINGKDVRTGQEAWNRFEDHHEAIIDKETFGAAQKIKQEHSKYNFRPKNCKEHLFHGLVYCGDCGAVEYAYSTKQLATQYICSTYFKYGKEKCGRHRIKESLLIDVAVNFLKLARESCREAIDSLDAELFPKRAVKSEEETIGRMEKELAGLDTQMQIIEEQRIKQILAHPEREDSINTIYDGMAATTQAKRDELSERIEQIKEHLSSTETSVRKAKTAIDVIDGVINSGTLTRSAVTAIFDRITVYDNGDVDIKLKPYLQILDPQHYGVTVKPHKQPEENYTISSEGAEKCINDDSEGEPQKMGGDVTQKALKSFNPLFTLNYSATHKERHNPIYVLDALDAYNKRLVKRIEVKGFEVKNFRGTDGYLYLESFILSPKQPPKVRMELEIKYNKSINRETRQLSVGDNLYFVSGEMEQYRGFSISQIDPIDGTVTFTNGDMIRKGEVIGDVSESDMRRVQIRETIISHFQKEAQLFHKGIKTLSLLFIDEVAHYRQYDADGNEMLGEFGRVFEEEYISVMNDYRTLLDPEYVAYLDGIDVHATHRGYFSIDKKTGRAIDSQLKRGSEFSDDISAYDLILKNKERLLSFEEPTRFIFSHSALREGWDNPNVFQICTLKHGGDSTTQKRQEVGRGLRLCVNQAGERMDAETVGADVHVLNTLTVIASEGYAEFVKALQEETKAVLYDRPRKATVEYFEGKNILMPDGSKVRLDEKQAKAIWKYLARNDYIDEDDGITQEYRNDAASGRLQPLPETLQPMSEGIHKLIQAIFDDKVLEDMIKDGNKTPAPENPLNDRFYKKEFQTLWNTINHKYAYTVDFDSDELIKKSIAHINSELFVSQLQYTVSVAGQKGQITGDDMRAGDSFGKVATHTETLKHASTSQLKYDIVGKVAEGTVLTRKTAAAILMGIAPDKFYMYRNNPEEFISKVIRLIKEQKATMIVEHITYDQIEGSYDSSIFTAEKHGKTLDQAFHADKAIQDYVFTDGTAEDSVERRFAQSLDGSQDVFIYAKLPKGFAIPTPVGNYSPDWAIVFHEGTVRHIYFIAETKGTMDSLSLRPIEKAKIDCAKKLFATLSNGLVTYDHVDSYQQLMNKVMQ